jgi:DNA-binding NtrC family response regulator
MQKNILLVDDDLSILDGFEEILTENHYTVIKAKDRNEALNNMMHHRCQAAVIDLVLKESSGLDLISQIRDISEDTAIIVLTGFPSMESAKESFKRGALEYLEKPCTKDNLLATIKKSIENQKAKNELNELKKQKELLDNLLCLDNEDLGARIRSVYTQMNIIIEGAEKFVNCPSEEAKIEYFNLIKIVALMAQNTLKKFIFNGLKVIIIDNDLLNLSTLNKELSTLGCAVTLCNNTDEAKYKFKSSNAFDLCIIEKGMPGMTGTELTRYIHEQINSQMPVINMTSMQASDAPKKQTSSDNVGLITKPVDMMQLKLLITDFILHKRPFSFQGL